jgi:hypothetical protein
MRPVVRQDMHDVGEGDVDARGDELVLGGGVRACEVEERFRSGYCRVGDAEGGRGRTGEYLNGVQCVTN